MPHRHGNVRRGRGYGPHLIRAELAGAFSLLTRLPAARLLGPLAEPARCVWAYPLVGAVVGGIAGAAYWVGHAAGLPAPVDAGWTLAVAVLLTGGLHEDGLADTADGFGGGGNATRKLAIMRDSRIGSYAALALIISLGVRGAAVAVLREPGAVLAALVAACALGRGAIVGLVFLLRPARSEGLGSSLGSVRPLSGCLGVTLAIACAMPLGRRALVLAGAGAVATLVFAGLARRQVGGYTGDVLGAGEQIVECATLSLAASFAT